MNDDGVNVSGGAPAAKSPIDQFASQFGSGVVTPPVAPVGTVPPIEGTPISTDNLTDVNLPTETSNVKPEGSIDVPDTIAELLAKGPNVNSISTDEDASQPEPEQALEKTPEEMLEKLYYDIEEYLKKTKEKVAA